MKRQPKVLSKNSDYKLVLDSCVYCIVPKPRVGLHVSTATVDEGIH